MNETDLSDEAPQRLPEPQEPINSRPQPFWDYIDLLLAVGVAAAALFVMTAITIGIALPFGGINAHILSISAAVQAELYLAVYVGLKVAFATRHHEPVFRSVGWRRSSFNLLLAALGGVLLAVGVSLLAAALHTPEVSLPIEPFTKSTFGLVFLVAMAVVAAPFFEELVFRGFLQPLLSRTFGIVAGILLTAILFGALHLPEYQAVWQYGLAIAIVGVVLGYLRYRTDSIIPTTVMHAGFNAISVVGLIATKVLHIK